MRSLGAWLRRQGAKELRWSSSLRKVGLFTLAVTVVSYWISYDDRIASRHESAWNIIRAAVTYVEGGSNRVGNLGQIDAIETLTKDCNSWWRGTIVQRVFELIFQDCVNLKSLPLSRLELGGLHAAGADLSHGIMACSNLAIADLANTNLQGVNFSGSNMSGVNLQGADLRDASLKLSNISWARFDAKTKIDISSMRCACITIETDENGQPYRHIRDDQPVQEEVKSAIRKLNACPTVFNRCEQAIMDAWNCGG